ncbi:hypothetical protein HOY82DRAFT_194379 [Tuber indicum]|nr:hypothetical protein HOY82DRAFT_194379 [Tuber indicum]
MTSCDTICSLSNPAASAHTASAINWRGHRIFALLLPIPHSPYPSELLYQYGTVLEWIKSFLFLFSSAACSEAKKAYFSESGCWGVFFSFFLSFFFSLPPSSFSFPPLSV